MADLSQQKINVRSMISIFENQTGTSEPTIVSLKRTKSVGHLSSTTRPVVKKPDTAPVSVKNLELAQIEHQVRHLQKTLNNYKKYSRENHIYYQNQIFFVLTDIVNVDAQDDPKIINEKSELLESMKRLNKSLNSLLPLASKRRKTEEKKLKKRRSIDETKSETKAVVPQISPRAENRVEEVQTPDEIDAAPPSVRSLKEIFEKNTTPIEVKREFGGTKLTRKFNTFNSSADTKYVSYSEKFKTSAFQEIDSVRLVSRIIFEKNEQGEARKAASIKKIEEETDDDKTEETESMTYRSNFDSLQEPDSESLDYKKNFDSLQESEFDGSKVEQNDSLGYRNNFDSLQESELDDSKIEESESMGYKNNFDSLDSIVEDFKEEGSTDKVDNYDRIEDTSLNLISGSSSNSDSEEPDSLNITSDQDSNVH